MSFLVLGLGSNLGNSHETIRLAIAQLNSCFGKYIEVSCLFQSESFGEIIQPDYLNLIVVYDVNNKNPMQCLNECQRIENELGRIRKEKWGPRTIDIDILFYDQLFVNTPNLTIPHPHINDRSFVVEPLSQLLIFENLKLFYHFNSTFSTKSINLGPL